MSKKGVVLSIILIVLLTSIAIILSKQNNKPKPVKKAEEEIMAPSGNGDFDLVVTSETGIDLSKLKAYNLPILIQLRFS